jgi:hypothetical protein
VCLCAEPPMHRVIDKRTTHVQSVLCFESKSANNAMQNASRRDAHQTPICAGNKRNGGEYLQSGARKGIVYKLAKI